VLLATAGSLTDNLLSGLVGTVVVLGAGYVGSRMKKHNVVSREAEQEAEQEKEHVGQRLTTLEAGHAEIMVVLKGRKRTWAEPEIVGLVEVVGDIRDDVKAIRNGNGHS
jgi:hypothetical protein